MVGEGKPDLKRFLRCFEEKPQKNLRNQKKRRNFAEQKQKTNNDSVAQLVEQMTLNHWVVSSSLTGVTES